MVFERARGSTRREWKWEEETIEEMKKRKYLGYIVQKNGEIEKHISERVRRAMMVNRHGAQEKNFNSSKKNSEER